MFGGNVVVDALAGDGSLQAPSERINWARAVGSPLLFGRAQMSGEGALAAEDYQGIYMVVETIKNQKNRLDLAQLEEGDLAPEVISGGYIFKFEWAVPREESTPTLTCSGSEPLGGGGFGCPRGQPGVLFMSVPPKCPTCGAAHKSEAWLRRGLGERSPARCAIATKSWKDRRRWQRKATRKARTGTNPQ